MTFGNYVLFNLLVAILVEGFQAEVTPPPCLFHPTEGCLPLLPSAADYEARKILQAVTTGQSQGGPGVGGAWPHETRHQG